MGFLQVIRVKKTKFGSVTGITSRRLTHHKTPKHFSLTDGNVKKFLFKMRQVFFFLNKSSFSLISFGVCLSRNENQCCLAYSEEQICNSNFNPLSKYQKYHVFSCRQMYDSIVYIGREVTTSEAVCLCKNRLLSEK